MKNHITFLCFDVSIDRRILNHAAALSLNGYDCSVIARPLEEAKNDPPALSSPSSVSIQRPVVRSHVPSSDIDFERLERLQKLLPPFYWSFERPYYPLCLIESLLTPARFIIANDLPTLSIGILSALYHGAYLMYDAHELYPEQIYFSYSMRKWYRRMESWLIPFVDMSMTVNNRIADEMVRTLGIEPPLVVPNYAPAGPCVSTLGLRERCGIPQTKRVLLYQGGLSPVVRNLENLVEAMALVRTEDVVLVLMGPDSGLGCDTLLKSLAERRNLLGSRVFLLDAIDSSLLASVTATADMGIIPYPPIDLNSLYCSPNKFWEYIQARVPILGVNSPVLNEMIVKKGVGLTTPMFTPSDIAEGIDTLCRLPLEPFRERIDRLIIDHNLLSSPYEKLVKSLVALEQREPPRAHTPELWSAISHARRDNPHMAIQQISNAQWILPTLK